MENKESELKPLNQSLKWISVKDKLPHRGDVVIGWSPDLSTDGETLYWFLEYENGIWSYYKDNQKLNLKITHWFDPCDIPAPEIMRNIER